MGDIDSDREFDRAVVKAVFDQAALRGWRDVSLVEAGQEAGLDLGRMRARFPGRDAVLLRFGAQADAAALASIPAGSPRERLFDALMNRFEALQKHRDGVRALLAAVPSDPATAMLLYASTLRSMKWLLEVAGVPAGGITGQLRIHGLMALWLYVLRTWERDDSLDLTSTMAAVDRGLDRAMQAEHSLPGRPSPPETAPGTTPDSAGAEPASAPLIGDFPDAAPTIV